MASVVEESVESIPVAQLAHLRERLLQQTGPEDDDAAIDTLRPDHHHLPTDASSIEHSDHEADFAAAMVPESLVAHRTPHASPHGYPPRMNVSKSATEAEMEAMVHHTPSQEAFTTLTRASSFHGYPGGDTQPMESQVYRDFKASSIITPAKRVEEEELTYETCGTDKTPRTLVEGDTQYANLVDALTSPGVQSNAAFEHDDDFEVTQIQAGTSLPPETPAVAGHKRRHSGEILTSVTTAPKTLGFSQLFGSGQVRPILSATQAFNQTQATSSPAPVRDGPRSDPAFTRPSPNLANRLATSSPPLPSLSSPLEITKSSIAGEPRDDYTRIHESQERRALLRSRAELGTRRTSHDAFSDDEGDDSELRRVARKRLQRAKSDEAVQALRRFGAPSRTSGQATPRPNTAPVVDLVTPALETPNRFCDITGLDEEEEESHLSDEEALGEEEAVEQVDLDNDQYDELAQTVIRSQVNEEDGEQHVPANGEHGNETFEADAMDMYTIPESTNIPLHDALETGPARTQHSTVADSQPMRKEHHQSAAQYSVQPPSSMSLFVPGSQYVGKTSQEQAQLAKQSWTLPEQHTSSLTDQPQERVPSSPPLELADITGPAGAQVDRTSNSPLAPQTVPESDLPMSDTRLVSSSRPASANGRVEADSNALPVFSTAPTHLSQPAPLSRMASSLASPVKVLASQHSQVASQSPITAAGVRRLADIAAMQSPRPSNETQVSVDAIMDDIMTAEDEEFFKVVSSPVDERPVKRRKLTRRMADRDEMPEAHAPLFETDGADEGLSNRDNNTEEPTKSDPAAPKPLRESPSKANEMAVKTPESVIERDGGSEKARTLSLSAIKRAARNPVKVKAPTGDSMDEVAQNSVRHHEEAGAKAASQLISKRSKKSAQNVAKAPRTSKANSKQTRDRPDSTAKSVEAEGKDDREEPSELGIVQDTATANANEGEEDEPQMIAPHRIFTLFKGTHNNFYAATWLHSLPGGSSHVVKFDDGTQTSIELQHIRRLELCVGDQVKVNLDGMRGKNWVIACLNATVHEGLKETDVYGRTHVQVQAKSSRSSMPTSTAAVEDADETVEVAVTDLYITHTMWPHFSDRVFTPSASVKSITSRAATPASTAQTTKVETPNSRTRRSLGGGKTHIVRSLDIHDDASATTDGCSGTRLFSNMAFAISSISNEGEKSRVVRMIKTQGGLILDDGFDELFDLSTAVDTSASSPGKKISHDAFPLPVESCALKLKLQYEDLGFVALIADRHSRRVKYMQALALDIPTLSSRWILDSLDEARNRTLTDPEPMALPWSKYLLPAGESSYLGGATRSRTIREYTAGEAQLSDTLNRRRRLLNSEGVLIVTTKKGRTAVSDRVKTYAFLTLALGAGIVKHVTDLQEAKALLDEAPGTWKWVYVDASVQEASSIVFGKRAAGGGKKRKRADDDHVSTGTTTVEVKGDVVCAEKDGVKIVNDEFVVQSLILGALVD